MTYRSLPHEPREPRGHEDPRQRISALVAGALSAEAEGNGYEAERLAGVAARKIEQLSDDTLDPGSPVAHLIEPGQRARAIGRPLPRTDTRGGHLALLRVFAAYSDYDGHLAEATSITADAEDLAGEIGAEGRRGAYVRETATLHERAHWLYGEAEFERQAGHPTQAALYSAEADALLEVMLSRRREVVAEQREQ